MKNLTKDCTYATNTHEKNAPVEWDSDYENRLDDAVINAIQRLDLSIAQANALKLDTMARILHTAKEELVFWAVEMNFHETKADKFINRLLYANSFIAAADFMEKFSSAKNPKKVLELLMNGEI